MAVSLIFNVIGSLIAFAINLLDIIVYHLLRFSVGLSWATHDLREVYAHTKEFSIEVDDESYDPRTETKPRRALECKDQLFCTPIEGVNSMKELLAYTVKANSSKECLGARKAIRKFVERDREEEHEWEVIEFENMMVYENYDQIYGRIMNFANGLTKLTGLNSKDIFGIFEETCKEWLLALHACFQYNIVVMTCYASLGEEALCYSINETEITALLVNEKSLGKILRSITPKCPSLKYIVYNNAIILDESAKKATQDAIRGLTEMGIKVLSFEEVEQLGDSEKNVNNITPIKEEPTLNSLALIMYTNGDGINSPPKGVMISHKNILSMVTAADQRVGDDPKINYQYIGYLPLAHIQEIAAEHVILMHGGRIGYGHSRTLSEKTARPMGDIEAISPTVLVGVPRVFDTIKKSAFERIRLSSPILQWLFHNAYNYKLQSLRSGRETPVWNILVFNKFRKLVGGNLALIISGGAALPKETQEFLRVCMSCSVITGYGLLETSGGGTIQHAYQPFSTKNVGYPINTSQIKLISVPDMGYSATGNEPRGEIAIKGNNVTLGYYKQDKLTKESYGSNGYFLTGDIGCLNKDGTFSIIDRKKNLTKLATGEYIALERLESIYGNSPFVSPNGIMVYGDSERDFATALVIAEPGHAKHWARENGISGDLNQIIRDPKYSAAVANSFKEEAKKNHLNRMEELKNFRVLTDEWTPENEMLTASMKLKRSNIIKKYKTVIEELYASHH